MLSTNEWEPLKTVIIGCAENAQIPKLDKSLRTVNYADEIDSTAIPVGMYPDQVIQEASEDLETLRLFLEAEGIEVLRPDKKHIPAYYNYCPRDSVLVHNDLILATPQPLRARKDEFLSMDAHFRRFQKQGVRYVKKNAERTDSLYNEECVGNKDILALTEIEPAFDAANILRCNDDLFYLVSNGGNESGAHYLQSLLPNKKIHLIKDVYSFMHLDSTIALLREGLMLLNPDRIKSVEQLPKPLQNWDVIWCPKPDHFPHYPGYCGASIWLNMNLLSINENLVVIEENQHSLRKELEKHNIECAMLPGRQQRTLGGGFHCVTLDLLRHS